MTMALPCDASRSVATCAGTAHPAALERPVVDQVAANAANVILDGHSGVVLGYRSSVSHLGHALMTLLTGGLWAVVWLVSVLNRREDRSRLEVDRWGNVWARHVSAP